MTRVLIASGKGGTGKTTVAAVLASLVARNRRLVVVDCDVEASNLPIALRAEVAGSFEVQGAPGAVVDPAKCQGCGVCIARCPFGAMSEAPDGRAVVDPWLCEGCGACVLECVDEAIRFEAGVGGEIVTGTTAAGPIVFGHLHPGEDLSGELVTQVRKRAEAIAWAYGAELTLLDGPPGVGCPAIAAMTGVDAVLAVTEPTVSGEHDLRRLVVLAGRLGVPVAVLLNKADLSPTGAERIRGACRDMGLALIGEVPFDPDLPALLEAVVQGTRSIEDLLAHDTVEAMAAAWALLEPVLLAPALRAPAARG